MFLANNMEPRRPGILRTVWLIAGLLFRRFGNRWRSGLRRRRKPRPGAPARTGTGRKSAVGWVGIGFIALIMAFNCVNITSRVLVGVRKVLGPSLDSSGRFEIDYSTYAELNQTTAELARKGLADFDADPSTHEEVKQERLAGLHEKYARWFESSTQKDSAKAQMPNASSGKLAAKIASLLSGRRIADFDIASQRKIFTQALSEKDWDEETLVVKAASDRERRTLSSADETGLEKLFAREFAAHLDTPERKAQIGKMLIQFRQMGTEGFIPRKNYDFIPSLQDWYSKETVPALWKVVSALLLLLAIAWLCMDLGSANQDLGRVEWTLEWLFTFPAPAGGLFAAQILGFALAAPLMWCGAWPMLTTIFASAGWGWWSVGMGSLTALYMSLLVASLRVVLETGLRSILAPPRLKNLQALFTVVGILGFYLLIATGGTSRLTPNLFAGALRLPEAVTWLPFTLPARLPALNLAGFGATLSAIAGSAFLLPLAAVAFCSGLVRGGLMSASGAYTGRRRVTRMESANRAGFLQGIIGKDIRLLLRDRNFLVQTLVIPLLVVGLQIVMNAGIIDAVRTKFQHASVMAFSIGGYVLIATALSVLSVEGNALYAPSAWTRLGQIVLSALLAYALWQKVRDRAPYLLDPVAAPPPSISLADGMIAALAFFVLQGLCMLILPGIGFSPGAGLFVAFVLAGAVVTAFALYIFARNKVPHPMLAVGYRRSPEDRPMTAGAACGLGAGCGLAAAGCAWIYLRVIDFIPAVKALKSHALALRFDAAWWLVAIAVFAAPVFEEFIFRGLVFRGLRRSTDARLAILGSAAVFAVVHPAISVVPVFVLGVVAAWSFERSKLLPSAITAHAVYNAAVIAMIWRGV